MFPCVGSSSLAGDVSSRVKCALSTLKLPVNFVIACIGYSVNRTGYLDRFESEVGKVKGRRSTPSEAVAGDERRERFAGGRASVWDETALRSHDHLHRLRAQEIQGFTFDSVPLPELYPHLLLFWSALFLLRPQVTYNENLVKIRDVVFEICEHTDIHTRWWQYYVHLLGRSVNMASHPANKPNASNVQ